MLPVQTAEFVLSWTVLTEFPQTFSLTVTRMKGVCHCLTDERLFITIMCLWIFDKAVALPLPSVVPLIACAKWKWWVT